MLDGAHEREREQTRLVAWQVATLINLWSSEPVSVAQLMGEHVGEEMTNDEAAILAEADRLRAIADQKQIAAEAGWDDVIPLMPEDL